MGKQKGLDFVKRVMGVMIRDRGTAVTAGGRWAGGRAVGYTDRKSVV